jgi:thiol-disulfide isomerase/thioredoxin
MPLIDAEAPPTSNDTHYVVYFASPENGQSSWCPDCRNALPALQNVFGTDSAPSAYVIQAGKRAEWRDAKNKWRAEPYSIACLPTIVRVENVS